MNSIAGYQVLEERHWGDETIILRAADLEHQGPVRLKTLVQEKPGPGNLLCLPQPYSLLQGLSHEIFADMGRDPPDLVILDRIMPRLDGHGIFRQLLAVHRVSAPSP